MDKQIKQFQQEYAHLVKKYNYDFYAIPDAQNWFKKLIIKIFRIKAAMIIVKLLK